MDLVTILSLIVGILGIIIAIIQSSRAKRSSTQTSYAHDLIIRMLEVITKGLTDIQKEKIAEIFLDKPELFEPIYEEIEKIRAEEAEADFLRG